MVVVRKVSDSDFSEVVRLVHHTIKTCYPAIFASQVVFFFLDYHNADTLSTKCNEADFYVAQMEGSIVACGYLLKNEIGGVYVHPEFQHKGIGKCVVGKLINVAEEKGLEYVWIDATPIAKEFYLSLGFELIKEMTDLVDGDVPLDYFRMHYCFTG